MGHFYHGSWRSGHWWHGTRGSRLGWWWNTGSNWYWFPAAVYPYPDPYTPPYLASGFWYWCDFYQNYYPHVGFALRGGRLSNPNDTVPGCRVAAQCPAPTFSQCAVFFLCDDAIARPRTFGLRADA